MYNLNGEDILRFDHDGAGDSHVTFNDWSEGGVERTIRTKENIRVHFVYEGEKISKGILKAINRRNEPEVEINLDRSESYAGDLKDGFFTAHYGTVRGEEARKILEKDLEAMIKDDINDNSTVSSSYCCRVSEDNFAVALITTALFRRHNVGDNDIYKVRVYYYPVILKRKF